MVGIQLKKFYQQIWRRNRQVDKAAVAVAGVDERINGEPGDGQSQLVMMYDFCQCQCSATLHFGWYHYLPT